MTPLTPLEDFRRILQYSPWHFWGLANSADVPVDSACNDIVYEYNWQAANAVGREAIKEALETAEARLREHLGFPIAPEYREETIMWPRYYDKTMVRRADWDPTGKRISLRVPDGYLQAVGVETLALVGNATLTFADDDGDGLKENWSLSIATTEDEPDKIAVYFIAADRLDSDPVGARWRVEPVKVAISGGTATVRGKRWQVVKPINYEGVDVAEIDPTVDANFAATLAVYNRTTDPDGEGVDTAQATLIWETNPCHGWWCCCTGCASSTTPADSSQDPAAIAKAVARVGIRSARYGELTPMQAVRNATTGVWAEVPWDMCREPDKVEVRYLAGYPLESGDVAKKLQTIVARLAAAEMPSRLTACDAANRELYRWQFDLARTSGANDEAYGAISAADLDNPLGTRRGQVYAWKQIRTLRNVIGVTTG